jgi:hypothetical protein
MPDSPEGVALVLLSMILKREVPMDIGKVALLDLYRECLEAVVGDLEAPLKH